MALWRLPAGYTGLTVGLVNTHYVYLPIPVVIQAARKVRRGGGEGCVRMCVCACKSGLQWQQCLCVRARVCVCVFVCKSGLQWQQCVYVCLCNRARIKQWLHTIRCNRLPDRLLIRQSL